MIEFELVLIVWRRIKLWRSAYRGNTFWIVDPHIRRGSAFSLVGGPGSARQHSYIRSRSWTLYMYGYWAASMREVARVIYGILACWTEFPSNFVVKITVRKTEALGCILNENRVILASAVLSQNTYDRQMTIQYHSQQKQTGSN